MNKALKISLVTLGAASFVVLASAVYKRLNNGVGILTSRKKMGRYVGMSTSGLNQPKTKENIDDWVESFWLKSGESYTKEWYKAVWNTEHGKPQETFKVGTEEFYTKGGRKK